MLTVDDLLEIVENHRKIRKKSSPDLTVTSFEKGYEIWNYEPVKKFFFRKVVL